MRMMKRFFLLALGLLPLCAHAQADEVQYNPNSMNPIARYEHLYKLSVWPEVDLREKQNKGFFARNGEISKLIIDAAKSGEIAEIFVSDSLTTKYTKQQFLDNLIFQAGSTFQAWDPATAYFVGDVVSFNGKN